MNENLNLVEILKDTPKGTKLYSTIYEYVEFEGIGGGYTYPIVAKSNTGGIILVTADGRHSRMHNGECTLFPSKNQRDWSKYKLDLPIDTPVMIKLNSDYRGFSLRYYAGNGRVFCDGLNSANKCKRIINTLTASVIIPFDKFNPNDIEESMKHNIENDENNK